MNFPINNYPTGAETDPNILYHSLGTFWTHIFQDRDILKGYTIGLAEEIIQRYYDLIEVIDSYAISDIPVFHTEKWLPLVLLKSKFGTAPLLFNKDDTIFGPQSPEDKYYQNVVMQFGFPKTPIAEVYLYDIGADFKTFGTLTDKIIDPNVFLLYGTDVLLDKGILQFNRNIFEDPTIAKSYLVGENGEKETFVDTDGNVIEEQMLILWAYHGQLDKQILFKNFGSIFNLYRTNDEFYKKMLESIFNLYIDGPTINTIKTISAAFLGVDIIHKPVEEVIEIFQDKTQQIIVTDQSVYKLPTYYNLLPTVKVGNVLYAGDLLVDAVIYHDNVTYPTGWWLSNDLVRPKLALSQYLFLGNYENQIILKNGIDLVTLDSDGNINFPIEGTPNDVIRFNSYLNSNAGNKEIIKSKLGLTNPGDAVPIHPIDFFLSNFLKNNTAFLKLKFSSQDIQAKFLALLPFLKNQLPPYIYLIFDLEIDIPTDVFSNLNGTTEISFNTDLQTLNADGSNSVGFIENLAPYGYKFIDPRLFSLSLSIPRPPDEYVATGPAATDQALEAYMKMTDGAPLTLPQAGESTTSFDKLLLLDFTQ